MSADRDTEGRHKRRRTPSQRGSRLLRGLRFILVLSLALVTYQHVTTTHAYANGPATETAVAMTTEAAERPCERERHHASSVCHAADSCPIFLPLDAVTESEPTAEAAQPMPDAFAIGRVLAPNCHPPKRSQQA